MSQVNKYADRAAYASDTNRLSTLSAVSLIASGNELIYDGVNVVVGKDAAAAGDCAVYDKTAGAIRFVKGETLSAAQLPESLTPLAVVYARQGDKVLIVSLDNPTISLWAASYEVALSGFDLPAGGTIVLKFADTYEKTITYTAGATVHYRSRRLVGCGGRGDRARRSHVERLCEIMDDGRSGERGDTHDTD